MALVTYYIAPCAGGAALNIDFDGSSLPTVGGNYYLTFTGATSEGCYEIVDSAEPATGVDAVSTMSTNYNDCATCLAITPTPTKTPTNTPTPTRTPTNTPTKTATPSNTPTNTPTPTTTKTPTPSVTTTKTPTPSVTATNTQTPTVTKTQTPSVTPSNTPTKSVTPSNTPTSSLTPSNTPTKSVTPTVTKTPTQTSTVTPTKTPTPTPTETPFGTFLVNLYYEYGTGQTGSYSGGTWNDTLAEPPHPVTYSTLDQDGKKGTVYQMNAIVIGGINGLNS
jgi:hypothetical protein